MKRRTKKIVDETFMYKNKCAIKYRTFLSLLKSHWTKFKKKNRIKF